tara:strand:- start:8906 stop:9694 length:789 start_codon:yes stop_codon:yes gene_type:complete
MIISLEGNIGSGKSTFYNYIKNHFSRYYNRPKDKCIYFLEEPVDDWTGIKDDDGNLIEHFYKNPEKYSFCFQMTAYISRLAKLRKILKTAKEHDIIVTERCVLSDYNVFAKMLHDTGKMNSIEYACYNKWFDEFLQEIPCILFVYISTDYNNCHSRIIKRSRGGEECISKEYLRSCEEYHNSWLEKEENKITIDGNLDTSFHPEHLDVLKQMINFDTNYPDKFDPDDSGDEYYSEYYFDKPKWQKRLYNRTIDECRKRLKKE